MKIGDRVIVNGRYANINFKDQRGKIVRIINGEFLIEFDNYIGEQKYSKILSDAETKPGYCRRFASPEMITKEVTIKERIEELEQELAELKALVGFEAQFNRKYVPQTGPYCVTGLGYVIYSNNTDFYVTDSRTFDTKEKAVKAMDILVKQDIILKYIIDHAPDYEPNEYDCASIFFCRDSRKWKRVLASDTDECIGTILMPIKVADKLADDLNNNRIDFN